MKLSMLKPFMPFINSTILAQLRLASAGGAALLVSRGLVDQSQEQTWIGVIWAVGTGALSLLDNFVVDGKITFATNQAKASPQVVSVTVAAATAANTGAVPPMATPQVTMNPIPHP